MNTHIAIECPCSDDDEEFDLIEFFQSKFDELEPALDLSVEDLDERACFFSAEIVDVQENNERVFIQYDVTYTAYYGCRDQDGSGVDKRDVTGVRQGNSWVFAVYVPPPRRSTFEEF